MSDADSLAARGLLANTARPRLLAEARIALSGLTPSEWVELLAFSSSAAAVGTVHSKFVGVARLASGIGTVARGATAKVGDVGLLEAVRYTPRAVYDAATAEVRDATTRFILLRDLDGSARTQALIDTVVAGVTAYAVAGGVDLEGGAPDLDLYFGVGLHRNPFSHTALLALTVEASMRFAAASLSRLHAQLPEDHSPMWDVALAAYDRTYESAIVGAWLGTSLHLLKDVGIPSVRTKPYVMLPMSLSNAGHQALFAGNAAAAACFGMLTALSKKEYTRCEPTD